ncbi:aldo/keto reductase [Halioxenophilus sp. WMMB6]|uniref:aldo/keto reductase n=1 Tax=Halioxenophilus sp. WMMB6 TaxID=3073815 RepID=UPI00295F3ED6|nr:aldo/keto reductase [Halioxenophilus sp. WMMB6]
MHTRTLGNSGLRVSSIGMGCNNFGLTIDAQLSQQLVDCALDAGVTLFDTAPVYGTEFGASEKILGAALGSRRSQVSIVTKFGMQPDYGRNCSRSAILNDVESSLSRLQTDYIDVYLLHWPDLSTSIEETLRVLDDLISAGKVRYIGCCNLPAWQVVEAKLLARQAGLHEFVVTQDEYSMVSTAAQHKLIPPLEKYGMGLMPYSPLANGLLTGKYTSQSDAPAGSRLANNLWNTGDKYLTPEKLAYVQKLSDYAQDHNHTLLELAVSWLLAQPVVCSVIAGSTKLEQLQQNLNAGDWTLSAEQMQEIASL